MNYFRDDLCAKSGIAWPEIPVGAFDLNNDLYLGRDGVIRPRHDWQGPEIDVKDHVSVIAACHVAIDNYNKAMGIHVD